MLWVIVVLFVLLAFSFTRCYGMYRSCREADEVFKQIVRLQSDMVLLFDRNFRVLRIFNPQVVEKSASELKPGQTSVSDYLSPLTVQWLEECVHSDKQGTCQREYALDKPEGKRYYEVYCRPFHENKFVCTLQDVTRVKEKELRITQQQELLDAVLDNIPFPLMIKDIDDDLRYVYWNRECDLQSGFNRREILGKNDKDIFGEERGAYYQKIDRQVIASGKPYRNQEDYKTGDGVVHDSIVYKNVLMHGLRPMLLVVRWEITDLVQAEKALREANRINRLILDNTHIGFVFLGPDFVVRWENVSTHFDHFKDNFYRINELCYRSVKGMEKICPNCIARQAIETGQPATDTLQFDNGATVEVVATAVRSDEGELLGVVLRLEDVTDRLLLAANQLKAKEEAEKAVQLKSAFINNMSHEIRTPLNAIAGFGGLLAETDDPQERATYISVVQQNIDLLLQLIHDIIDVSEVESGTMEFVNTEVELNTLLKDVEQRMRIKAIQPNVEVRAEYSRPVCIFKTDPDRLAQVLNHLLVNALKFTERGHISFGYQVCDDHLRFYVEDTGVGIPKEKQEAIFERFMKLDRFRAGTGLGLPLCQLVVEKLGGWVGLDSEPGQGSTFWFTLPGLPLGESDSSVN